MRNGQWSFVLLILFSVAGTVSFAAEAVRPARPPKEKLMFGLGKKALEVNEGRRIILDEDSYPREPARIVKGPKIIRKGGGFVIRFALDKPDDALVRIVDGGGNTVRNVACGVLGWNAPAPFKVDSLSQEIFWDGKDANGKPAPAGCKVKLCVGLRPRFDRFVAHDPAQMMPEISALEVDPKGRVYVGLFTAYRSDDHILRFDREGKFLDTPLPFESE